MRRLKTLLTGVAVIGVLYAGTTMANAQDQAEDNGKVKPASRVNPLLTEGDQSPTLGSPEIRHSYWVPGIQYSNVVGSSALNQATAAGWNSTSYLTGNVSL